MHALISDKYISKQASEVKEPPACPGAKEVTMTSGQHLCK